MHNTHKKKEISIIEAIQAHNENTVLTLLDKEGVNPNYINNEDNKTSLLHYAVYVSNIKIVELLLIKGANPDIKNKDGVTPTGIAFILYGFPDWGVSASNLIPDWDGGKIDLKALKAVKAARKEILLLLLKYVNNFDCVLCYSFFFRIRAYTNMHIASSVGDTKTLKRLLKLKHKI